MIELHTFSVVAYDKSEKAFGVAVTTARPNVGSICPFVSLNGAVGTQARVNPDHGRNALELFRLGVGVQDALTVLLKRDPERELRQLHGVDAQGCFAFTGTACVPWAGQHAGGHFSVAGNMLAGPDVVVAAAEAMRSTQGTKLNLAQRLIGALEAGQAAGGDKRGKQSAALVIASPRPRWYHNLRVDDHATPVAELRRLYGVVAAESDNIKAQYDEKSLDLFSRVKW